MALQAFSAGGLWLPNPALNQHSLTAGAFVIDASGEKVAVIVKCPKAGTLDRFDFNVATVTNSPDNGLRASFQGVDATTGLPDGVILGATNNAFVTYAHTVTTGWKSTDFGETVTVTRGQLIAMVVDIPSFTAGDSVTLSHWVHGGGGFTTIYPYGISATSTKSAAALPILVMHYTDGYACLYPHIVGANSQTATGNFNSGTAVADEWGLAFQVPFPCKLSRVGVLMAVAAGADFEIDVYDSADGLLASPSFDGDVTSATTAGGLDLDLGTDLTLSPNVTYRVTVRPTTVNDVNLRYLAFQSAALMNTIDGGSSFYMTSRLNQGGSWTDYNSGTFRRPSMSLLLTAFDAGGFPASRVFTGM